MDPYPFCAEIPWADVRDALAMLRRSATGAFHPRPVGNRVVIDFQEKSDAAMIVAAFAHARLRAGDIR